jgi:hypothetical protein
MTMADRIVVMKDGYIMQVGTPKEIYDNPNNIFVGGFIGTPPMNFITGTITKDGFFHVDRYKIRVPEGKLEVVKANDMFDTEIVLGIRPEDIHDDKNVFEAYPEAIVDIEVDVAELLGAETHIYSNLGQNKFSASVDARYDVRIGDKIKLVFDMNKCHFFDPASEERLTKDGNVKEIRKEIKRIETERKAKEQAEKAELERLKVEDPQAYEKRLAEIRREERLAQREAKKQGQARGDEKPGLIEKISIFLKERKAKRAEAKAAKALEEEQKDKE